METRQQGSTLFSALLVLIALPAFNLARITQQQASLPDEIERQVGESEVFLERRGMPYPLAQALPQHQAGVTQAQHVAKLAEKVRHGGDLFREEYEIDA